MQKLKDISNDLEQGAFRSVARNMFDTPSLALMAEKETGRLRRLNDQWLEGLQAARKLKGFENFLRAKPLTTLQAAAAKGPVVILNASKSECAALVVKSGEAGVLHVPLPEFTVGTVKELVSKMRNLANSGYPRAREDRASRRLHVAADSEEDNFRVVLATLWASVVVPVLRSLDLEVRCCQPQRLFFQ